MDSKLDKIAEDITDIKVTSAKQEVNLENLTEQVRIHVKRTDLLELEIKPIKEHVALINACLKILGLTALLAGLGWNVIELLRYFRS